jgi:glycine cleavage system transcriptional repressor
MIASNASDGKIDDRLTWTRFQAYSAVMAETAPIRYVMSILVSDRVGILRDITSAVTDAGGNIDGISQTVVSGFFTVILTASFAGEQDVVALRQSIEGNFKAGEVVVVVRPHREGTPEVVSGGRRYMLTLMGTDRPGVLKTVTGFLADRGINIEDWDMQLFPEHVTHVAELRLPPELDLCCVGDELQQVVGELGLRATIQHENLFRATSEIGPIRSLLEGETDA